MNSSLTKVSAIISEIRDLNPNLIKLYEKAQIRLSTFTKGLEVDSIDHWKAQILADVILRLRHFIEHNLSHIESLGTLSLCRYMFELVVWLKHIELDDRFALYFTKRVYEGQIEHYERLTNLYKREIEFYRSLAYEERKLHKETIDVLSQNLSDPKKLGEAIAAETQRIVDLLDARLSKELILMSDDIAENGYSSQAHLIETRTLPEIDRQAGLNRESLRSFEIMWETQISVIHSYFEKKEFNKNGEIIWKWNKRAERVGMTNDYDFIYSYTSRLLHANPVSVSTNQQTLTDDELLIFWRYIKNQSFWVHDYANNELSNVREASGIH